MDQLKNHIVPFVIFGALGLAVLWYVIQSFISWRRDGRVSVRNRFRWMPLGATATTILEIGRDDPTDDRPVHLLKNPAVIALWLTACVSVAGFVIYAAYSFLRFGHGLQSG